MSYLGNRYAVGVLSGLNLVTPGAWVVTFGVDLMPQDADFEIYHGFARGPGGYFLSYIDNSGYGAAENGLINEYSPAQAMYVRKGQIVTLHWSIDTTPAPQVWFYLRTPKDV